jgi:DNA-binding NarL/FixJ family response regulator
MRPSQANGRFSFNRPDSQARATASVAPPVMLMTIRPLSTPFRTGYYSDKRIADNMVITPDTVLYHLRSIASKWGVRTRHEIRTYAREHRLVSLE